MKPRTIALQKVIHLLALAFWGGGAAFFSFVTTPRIFGYLRDQLPANSPAGLQGVNTEMGRRLAGETVGAIFPNYFACQILLGVLAVASGFLLAKIGQRLEKVRCGLALAALAIVTVHASTVYPHSVRVLDAHYASQAAGDEPKAAELRRTFGMWHGVSQLLNLTTIILVVTALVFTGLTLRDSR